MDRYTNVKNVGQCYVRMANHCFLFYKYLVFSTNIFFTIFKMKKNFNAFFFNILYYLFLLVKIVFFYIKKYLKHFDKFTKAGDGDKGRWRVGGSTDKWSIKIGALRNVGTFSSVYSSVSLIYIILKLFIPQKTCLY